MFIFTYTRYFEKSREVLYDDYYKERGGGGFKYRRQHCARIVVVPEKIWSQKVNFKNELQQKNSPHIGMSVHFISNLHLLIKESYETRLTLAAPAADGDGGSQRSISERWERSSVSRTTWSRNKLHLTRT